MKNPLKFLALTALVPVAVYAQGSLDEEVNAELDRMYGQQTTVTAPRTRPSVQVTVSQSGPTTQSNANVPTVQMAPVTQQSALQSVQKQPTTIIEAAPLTESGAEKLRKTRQDAELSTEQTIVEKLEQSRLDDEKKRAEVLFGDKFNSLANKEQQPAPVVAPVGPVVVPTVAPVAAPAVVELSREDEKDMIKGEVSAALAELKSKEDEKPKSSSYFGVMAGTADYPNASNVRGHYSLGLAYGKKYDDRLVAEGSFLYSNYEVRQRDGGNLYNGYGQLIQSYPRITEMNQYSTSGLVKYQLLSGMIRPEVGALLSYTYRTFSDTQMALSNSESSSHALDMGLMTGASLELSETFALGMDFRYMWNLTNKVDSSGLQRSFLATDKPIEKFNYYTFSILGKATF